jgi:hypothetical protein
MGKNANIPNPLCNFVLTNYELLHIQLAANGRISGTLSEWPLFATAILKSTEHTLPDTTTANFLRILSKGILKEYHLPH